VTFQFASKMGVVRRSESLGRALVNCLHENIVLLAKQTVDQDVKKFSILNGNPVTQLSIPTHAPLQCY